MVQKIQSEAIPSLSLPSLKTGLVFCEWPHLGEEAVLDEFEQLKGEGQRPDEALHQRQAQSHVKTQQGRHQPAKPRAQHHALEHQRAPADADKGRRGGRG